MIRLRPEQLCLFKFQRPLLERFGKEFFRNIPKTPGVYLFIGANQRVLYIGQSQNLRQRLAYYKNAQPEREPRRIVRLVHQTSRIELECCKTVADARLRELALIGQHRPRFNVANTLSPTFTFFGLREFADRFALRIMMKPIRRDGELLIGAFRNRGLCSRAFSALARTLSARERTVSSIFNFPAALHARATEWDRFCSGARPETEAFLRGEQPALLKKTKRLIENASDPFLKQLFETDLLTLSEFFELAQQMRAARQFHDVAVLSHEALQVSAHQMRLVTTPPRTASPAIANPGKSRSGI